jgi:hypothetical protein
MILRLAGAAIITICVLFSLRLATEVIKNFGLLGSFPAWIAPVIPAAGVIAGVFAAVWQQSLSSLARSSSRLCRRTESFA